MSDKQSEFDKNTEVIESLDQFEETLYSKSNEQLDDDLKMQEKEMRELRLVLMRDQAATIKARISDKLARFEAQNLATRQFLATRKAIQDHCNHRKGGIGHQSVINGEGTDAMYCVIKHKKPNGTFMILCARCGKEWHGPFYVSGELIEEATPGYENAISFPTDSSPSGSGQFQFFIADPIGFRKERERKEKEKANASHQTLGR